MTAKEFDDALLPRKLNMHEYEAARLVLVHGAEISAASEIYNLTVLQIKAVIALFNDVKNAN